MTWIAAGIMGGVALYNGMNQSNAISSAAQGQANAAQSANNLTWGMYQQNQGNLRPYMDAGNTSAQALNAWNSAGGGGSQHFNFQDWLNSPGYNFQMQQGQQALDRSMGARGVGVSTGEMQAQQQFGQGLASQGYQQAFNNFNTTQQTRFNQLASVAGMGENAAAGAGNNGLQTANMMGNNTMNAANGGAAAALANANNWNSAINTGANAFTNASMMGQGGQGGQPGNYAYMGIPGSSSPNFGNNWGQPIPFAPTGSPSWTPETGFGPTGGGGGTDIFGAGVFV